MKWKKARFETDFDFIVGSQIKMAKETEDFDLNPETVSNGVRAVFEDARKGFYLIAEDEASRPCGCLLVVTEWSDWRNK